MTRLLFLAAILALLPCWVFGQTQHIFTATTGDWNTPGNWDTNEVPDGPDTAVIGTGKTCKVQNANQAIKSISFSGTGKLEIIDKTFTIGSASASTTTSITDAILLKDGDSNSSTIPTLKVHNNTTLKNGKIKSDPGVLSLVTWANSSSDTLYLTSDSSTVPLEVAGSIQLVVNLNTTDRVLFDVQNGDSVQNTMYFGGTSGDSTTYTFVGAADLKATASGIAIIRKMNINGADGEWETNAEIRLEETAVANATNIYFRITKSGLLATYTDLRGRKIYMYGAGNAGASGNLDAAVNVATGVVAIFEN